MSDFKDRYGPWAVIAGASEGLGEAFAIALAERGLNLILWARREQKLTALAQRLRDDYSVDVIIRPLDLANPSQAEYTLSEHSEDIGLLVYNAAYSPIGPFADTDSSELRQAINVNVISPTLLSRQLATRLRSRGRGGIVLMSSLAGNQGGSNIATYAATKAYNTVLGEGLWQELRRQNIDVVAPCAGAIRTPNYLDAETGKEAPGTVDASLVAETALDGLGKTPIVIPGRMNQFALFLMRRLLPRKRAIKLMAKNTESLA